MLDRNESTQGVLEERLRDDEWAYEILYREKEETSKRLKWAVAIGAIAVIILGILFGNTAAELGTLQQQITVIPVYGSDGNEIRLFNNPNAEAPTYRELLDFTKRDPTDLGSYVEGEYACAEFAREVHNNAEAAGIKAGYAAICLNPTYTYSIYGGRVPSLSDGYHALNVFNTTDMGPVYIDCTGLKKSDYGYGKGCDTVAYVVEGSDYRLIGLDGSKWESIGKVKSIDIYW